VRRPWLIGALLLAAILVAGPALASTLGDDEGPRVPTTTHPRPRHEQAPASPATCAPATPRRVPDGKHPALASLCD
jgi:hypothetical protein